MVSLQQRAAFHEAGHTAAALAYCIPIISVSIDAATPHLQRGRYQQPDIGLESLVNDVLGGSSSGRIFLRINRKRY
jgi:hypothetical protein